MLLLLLSNFHAHDSLLVLQQMENKKAFGFGVMDYVLIVPNAIGVVLGVLQMLLRMVVPSNSSSQVQDRTSEVEKVNNELSLNNEDQ